MQLPNWLRRILGLKDKTAAKPIVVEPPKPTPPPTPKPPQAPRKPRVPYKCLQTGKRCYATREYATLQRDRLKNGTLEKYLRIYVCEFCNYWHLTHHKRYKF